MNEIISKISSYNFFNYLFPGVIFCILTNYITDYKITWDNLVLYFFVFYLVWLIISRFWSLCIKPLLEKIWFLKPVDYEDFTEVEKEDKKIEILSEQNNLYRTLVSLFSLLLLLKLYELVSKYFWLQGINQYVLIVWLLIVFLVSYRKQTKYIVTRIKNHKNQS